jgi:hypothetical protein
MKVLAESQINHPNLIRLTSLRIAEFLELLSEFAPICENYFRTRDLEGKPRRIPKCKEDERCSLKGGKMKLLFILSYMKENPTQAYQGWVFNMEQPRVSKWIKVLLPLLRKALEKLGKLPRRFGYQLYAFLLSYSRYVLFMDVTERDIPRSEDYERQKYEYSGKKKSHTIKNNIVSDENNTILFLSDTYAGSIHDKVIADQAGHQFPNHTILLEDSGFQGYDPENITVLRPEKKPKGGELSRQQKELNRQISQLRVPVEHAMSGIKRLRIVQEKIRIRTDKVRDLVMLIACALHNLRISFRNH